MARLRLVGRRYVSYLALSKEVVLRSNRLRTMLAPLSEAAGTLREASPLIAAACCNLPRHADSTSKKHAGEGKANTWKGGFLFAPESVIAGKQPIGTSETWATSIAVAGASEVTRSQPENVSLWPVLWLDRHSGSLNKLRPNVWR